LLCNNHVLIEGVPGLAKTLSVTTLARMLQASFQRIQFTPDLLPADVIGTLIYNPKTGDFTTKKGPIFANIILADEINRAPAKVQSALLEAMQERQVTIGDGTYPLDDPFLVMATQNPIEQEGTYPLPEAQLDRFMFNLWIDYPTRDEERTIVRNTTGDRSPVFQKPFDPKRLLESQNLVRRVPVSDHVLDFAIDLTRRTRPDSEDSPVYIRDWVSWGAGPRACQYLILGAKSLCALDGRPTPEVEDVKRVAKPVLRHRIVTNFNAEADGIKTTDIIDRLLQEMQA
jgi:MoxR-like ATPase